MFSTVKFDGKCNVYLLMILHFFDKNRHVSILVKLSFLLERRRRKAFRAESCSK